MIRLLFTSGRGPAECRIALAHALDRLAREARDAGLDVDIASGPDRDGNGPASAIVVIHGDAADSLARRWTGSVAWVSPSPVRPHHKRKNWFIGVFELPAQAARCEQLAVQDVAFEAFCAGGPGGQHQNKTESAVRATHLPTGLAVVARDERSQHRNKALALERLAALVRSGSDLAAIASSAAIQAAHDQLERGRPVRRFTGRRFEEG